MNAKGLNEIMMCELIRKKCLPILIYDIGLRFEVKDELNIAYCIKLLDACLDYLIDLI
jgi:hypothetical protein